MTHGDGFPRLSARSAWRGDAGHRKPCGTPSESLGKPPFRSRRRTGSGRFGGGVGKPCRCPASPAASLLPARWPDASPARSLWVIISAPWYERIAAHRRPAPGRRARAPGPSPRSGWKFSCLAIPPFCLLSLSPMKSRARCHPQAGRGAAAFPASGPWASGPWASGPWACGPRRAKIEENPVGASPISRPSLTDIPHSTLYGRPTLLD